jgi:hypothetical protein
MAVSNDINVNIEAIKKAIDYAQEEKADIPLILIKRKQRTH